MSLVVVGVGTPTGIITAGLVLQKKLRLAEMNFDPELRSNSLVFGIPMDLHEEDIKEIQDTVSGELTLGGYIQVDPSKALKESTNDETLAWQNHACIKHYKKH